MQPVRVQSIVLDHTHPKYRGEGSIGTVIYSELGQSIIYNDKNSPFTAKPLSFNISHYPVPQEIVYLIRGPKDTYMSSGESEPYYIGPLNVLGNPSTNGIPTVLDEEGKYYEGEYFISDRLAKIRPLRPYEGDITFEGRYGQSIRFGSTVDSEKSSLNNWSNGGKIGDPITIIRNGQHEDINRERFELIEENINEDHSSIYLCSHQQIIGFKPASTYDESYGQNIFKDNVGEEAQHTNESMDSNIEEDITLNTADPLPAHELIKNEELAQLSSQESPVAYYDIAPTEDQAIDVNNTDNLTTNYIVPNNQANSLNTTLG